MRVSFDLNVKAVLAVVAIGALSAGSFVTGEYHGRSYERRRSLAPVVLSKSDATDTDGLIMQALNRANFCEANPNRAYILGSDNGTCTADGQVPDRTTMQQGQHTTAHIDPPPPVPTVTEKQWDSAYEKANAPYCYGHPHNEREVEIIAQFNMDEAVARNAAYARGEIRNL